MPNVAIPGYGTYWFPNSLKDEEIEDAIRRKIQEYKQSTTSYGALGDFAVSALQGAGETLGTGLAGITRHIPLVGEPFAKYVSDLAHSSSGIVVPTGTTAAQAGNIAGSTAAYLGTAALTGGLGAGALGVGAEMEEQRRRMEDARVRGQEVSASDEILGQLGAAGLGALQAIPGGKFAAGVVRPLRAIAGPAGEAGLKAATEYLEGSGLGSMLTGALAEGAYQGGANAAAVLGQNEMERRMYNPDRGTWEGVGEAAGVGGGIGALAQLIGAGVARRAARGRIKAGEPVAEPAAKPTTSAKEVEPKVEPEISQSTPAEVADTLLDMMEGGVFTDEEREAVRARVKPIVTQEPVTPVETKAPEPTPQVIPEVEPEKVQPITATSASQESQLAELARLREEQARLFEDKLRQAKAEREAPAVVKTEAEPPIEEAGRLPQVPKRIKDMSDPRVQTIGEEVGAYVAALKKVVPDLDTTDLDETLRFFTDPEQRAHYGEDYEAMGHNALKFIREDMKDLRWQAEQAIQEGKISDSSAPPEPETPAPTPTPASPVVDPVARPDEAPAFVAPEPVAAPEPEAPPSASAGSLNERLFSPDLGVSQGDFDAFLDRHVNHGLPIQKALAETFGDQSLDLQAKLQKAGLIEYDSGKKQMVLTDDGPAARVLPEPEAPPAPPAKAAPDVEELRKQVRQKVLGQLNLHWEGMNLGAKAGLRLAEGLLTRAGGRALGEYSPEEGFVTLAMHMSDPAAKPEEIVAKLKDTLNHEAIHVAWDMFNEKDRAALIDRAKKKGHLEKAQKNYADERLTPDEMNQEAVAELFRSHLGGEKLPAIPKKLFDRFMGFTERLGNSFRGLGFQNAEDVMARLASGKLTGETGETKPAGPRGPRKLYQKAEEDPYIAAAKLHRQGQSFAQLLDKPGDREVVEFLANRKVDLDRLAEINPDDYLNIGKHEMSDRTRELLRAYVRVAAVEGGFAPKDRVTFEETEAAANRLISSGDFDAKRARGENGTLNPAARLAANKLLNGLTREIMIKSMELNRDEPTGVFAKSALKARREAIDQMTKEAQDLIGILTVARTQDGRNLGFHRMMAAGSYDPVYWTNQAKRNMKLPPGVNLPADLQQRIIALTEQAKKAAEDLKAAQEALKANPTPENVQAAKDAKKDVQQAQQDLGQKVAETRVSSALEVAVNFIKAGLLTGPKTLTANQLSNLTMSQMERASSLPASWFDAAMSAATGERTIEQKALNRYFNKGLKGQFESGFKEGASEIGPIMREGVTGKGGAYTDQELGKVGVNRRIVVDKRVPGAKLLEGYINGVYAAQAAGDRPWSKGAKQMFLAEQANLEAEKLARFKAKHDPSFKGEARNDWTEKAATHLRNNPTKEMEARAEELADIQTFSNENLASVGVEALKQRIAPMRGGPEAIAFFDTVMPFVKVPTNVLARVLDYTPVGVVRGSRGAVKAGVIGALKAAGKEELAKKLADKILDPYSQRVYAELMGRGLIGSGLLYLGYMGAKAGVIAGNRDKQDVAGKATDEAVGRSQGAIKIGDHWVQMSRLSPLGNVVALGASLYREGERPLSNISQRIPNLIGAAVQNVGEMPFMQGAENIIQAYQSPGNFAYQYAQKQIGSAVPTIVKDIATAIDPVQRDIRGAGLLGAVQQRTPFVRSAGIPGLVKGLPERKDVFGQTLPEAGLDKIPFTDIRTDKIPYVPSPGQFFDPFRTQRERQDPVSQQLIESEYGVGRLQKKAGESEDTFRSRRDVAGVIDYINLLKLTQSGEFQRATKDEQRELLAEAHSKSRREAGKIIRAPRYKNASEEERQQMLNEMLQTYRATLEPTAP